MAQLGRCAKAGAGRDGGSGNGTHPRKEMRKVAGGCVQKLLGYLLLITHAIAYEVQCWHHQWQGGTGEVALLQQKMRAQDKLVRKLEQIGHIDPVSRFLLREIEWFRVQAGNRFKSASIIRKEIRRYSQNELTELREFNDWLA